MCVHVLDVCIDFSGVFSNKIPKIDLSDGVLTVYIGTRWPPMESDKWCTAHVCIEKSMFLNAGILPSMFTMLGRLQIVQTTYFTIVK